MKVEICDLCHKRVYESNKTTVIIKDFKGMDIDPTGVYPAKRKFEGVICNDCLKRLRDATKEEE